MEPTLQAVFGANAVQDATTITLTKADFAALGFVSSADNTAESIFAAIVLNAKPQLTQAGFEANIDQSIVIENSFPNITNRGVSAAEYRNDPLTINLWKPSTGTVLNPMDY
ncbi:hypothetical protein [Nodularia sp. UHCC 0506]|uniref:hypothetical protein n=1 Tax=Nodularia sp. UHCC 0506 TaxID=3110243 RepID=UPI002B21804B|nr:hypothetical protein [Nodularia sp. UHCC 0506]MEA5516208.1 hypothetical protein [Nodularia sp. UHCC 0506]